jgi:hypothetical protein
MGNKKDINSLDFQLQKLAIEKSLLLEKQLKSNDPEDILKAQLYLKEQNKQNKANDFRAFLFDPNNVGYNNGNYKEQKKRTSFEVLKKVADTPHVGSIINTRIFQMMEYLQFVTNDKERGYTIRVKKSLFDDKNQTLNREDKNKIQYIVDFLENGGKNNKWDIHDDLNEFVRKVMRDSLTYDQLAFECERTRRFELIGYGAIDASTIRILNTIDTKFDNENKARYDLLFGQYPRYGQVFQGNLAINPKTNEPVVYYPFELGFAQRNKTTDYTKNGYGTSEIEILLDIITWTLWGMEYNGNFFKQGSNPKGFMNIKGDVNQDQLNDFRQTWRQLASGVDQSHKLPIMSGLEVEWVDLHKSNNDMEFQNWMEFLIVLLCSVYTIDPTELGYSFKGQAQVFGQDGQKARLEHSKEKGLKPLLKFLQKVINKWLVSELDERFEFVFCGIDTENESVAIELDTKKLASGLVSFESMYEKHMGRPYNKETDTILNPVFLQNKQMGMYGGEQSNEAINEMTNEPEKGAVNPFAEGLEKSVNPIMNECMKYVNEKFDLR